MFVLIGKMISFLFILQIVAHFFPKIKKYKAMEYVGLITQPVLDSCNDLIPIDDKLKPIVIPFAVALLVTIVARVLAFIL